MSKPNIEKLEANINTLLEAYRKLRDESKRLTVQVEILTSENQSCLKEKEFFKEKLERLSDLEASKKNNEFDRIQVRKKVVHLLEKLETFDLT
jgi:chromosome segregation ATPase